MSRGIRRFLHSQPSAPCPSFCNLRFFDLSKKMADTHPVEDSRSRTGRPFTRSSDVGRQECVGNTPVLLYRKPLPRDRRGRGVLSTGTVRSDLYTTVGRDLRWTRVEEGRKVLYNCTWTQLLSVVRNVKWGTLYSPSIRGTPDRVDPLVATWEQDSQTPVLSHRTRDTLVDRETRLGREGTHHKSEAPGPGPCSRLVGRQT